MTSIKHFTLLKNFFKSYKTSSCFQSSFTFSELHSGSHAATWLQHPIVVPIVAKVLERLVKHLVAILSRDSFYFTNASVLNLTTD